MSLGPVVVIVGPTGVGKTELALALANRLGKAEIISADSKQVYRYMDIGTAKPTLEERTAVKHHLVDIRYPDERFSAGDFKREAEKVIDHLHASGIIPLVVGGTFFYVHALTCGLSPIPAVDPKVRGRLEDEAVEEGSYSLYQRLSQVDPESASRIHPNDTFRLVRALGVWETTGVTISRYRRTVEARGYRTVKIGLTRPREALYRRIDERADRMVEAGLVEEVSVLLKMGYERYLVSMEGCGYKELIPYLKGEMPLNAAIGLLKRNSRRYAKRQMSWMRRERETRLIDVEGRSTGDVADEMMEVVEKILLRQSGSPIKNSPKSRLRTT
jgi:tRNA dimethylallyltransferase